MSDVTFNVIYYSDKMFVAILNVHPPPILMGPFFCPSKILVINTWDIQVDSIKLTWTE